MSDVTLPPHPRGRPAITGLAPGEGGDDGVLHTPFHGHASACNTRQQWQVLGGCLTARSYGDARLEHAALRSAVGVADHSWLVKYRLRGRHATDLLARLCTGRIASLAVGRTRYALMCQDDGRMRDDGLLMRLGEQDWRLCTRHRHLDWLMLNARGLDAVEIDEESTQVAVLAVCGPLACRVLRAAGLAGVETLVPGALRAMQAGATSVTVSRTGFTGDLAYELWLPADRAAELWPAVFAAADGRARPVGREAVELARLEAGHALAGHEFHPAHLTEDPEAACSPLELGLGRFVDWDRPGFNGREALRQEAQARRHRRLAAMLVEGAQVPRAGSPVTNYRHRPVGWVTSAAWSPSVLQNIALVMLEAGTAPGADALWAEVTPARGLGWQRRRARLRPHRGPFYDPVAGRVTPPPC